MNRRLLLSLTALSVMPVASGCRAMDVVVDQFGPRPDKALVELAARADADSQALKDARPDWAALREAQSQALYQEIARQCGTDDSGNTPESCQVTRQDAAPTAPAVANNPQSVLADAAEATLAAAGQAPQDSAALLITQAIVLRATSSATSEDISSLADAPALDASPDDAASARELLQQEYATVYGLDIARTRGDSSTRSAIDTAIDLHEHIIAALHAGLAPTGDVPQTEPAYVPGEGLSLDAGASATEFADEARDRAAAGFTHAAVSVKNAKPDSVAAQWRDWLVSAAAQLENRVDAAQRP